MVEKKYIERILISESAVEFIMLASDELRIVLSRFIDDVL